MREYETTHPWVTFTFQLERLNYDLWIMLGEAQSKCEHIANTPLKPSVAAWLHTLYLAKGALGTTAIEGNTLSEQEAVQKIEGRLSLPPSKEYLGKEIENVVNACNLIGRELLSGSPETVNCEKIKEYNRMVLEGLDVNEAVIPGELRHHSVGVEGVRYRGAPAEDCEYLLNRLCDWLNSNFKPPNDGMKIVLGVLKSIVAHIYIAWIHPFGDGNGRTARLVEFQILLASGVPTPAAHLLSNFYNETRQEYYRQLDRTSRSGGDIIPFIEYALKGFVQSLRSQLSFITQQVWDVTWVNLIHDEFKNRNRRIDDRRRHLALDISATPADERVFISTIRQVSPRMAEHYAGKTEITIRRDLKALIDMDLIYLADDGTVHPNRGLMMHFLPQRRRPGNRQQN